MKRINRCEKDVRHVCCRLLLTASVRFSKCFYK